MAARNAFTGYAFVRCHYCDETISVSQPIVRHGEYAWHQQCAPAKRTRRCAAHLDCGHLDVPVADLSFRGFCPDCEAIAQGQVCCFERCYKPATRHLGSELIYPMCDEHYAKVVSA
jgi:hypothetical protein